MPTGIRIEDLMDYGSFDIAKMASDIFEVSKNSGTAGSPIYASDGSRQIKLSQLSALIGKLLPGGYIPLLGPNYLVVSMGENAIAAGANLIDAVIYAQGATPNGNPLAADNRFTVLLYPGVYDLGTEALEAISEYVDIVGVGEASDIIITSSNAVGVAQISDTNNYILKNLSIKNSGSGKCVSHNAGQTDNGLWSNVILYNQTTEDVIFGGYYEKLTGLSTHILNGSITGVVRDSIFSDYSCGRSFANDILISGLIENVTTGSFSCGNGVNVTISGILRNVKTGSNSMGCSNVFGDVEFTSAATLALCQGTGNNFGRTDGNVIINCTMIECVTGGGGFGYSVLSDSTIDSSAILRNCKSVTNSFCSSRDGVMTINGTLENCKATTSSFGDTSATGKLINCVRTGGFGTHSGTIENCKFSENSSTEPVITIDEGAILTRSRFTQNGTGDCIFGAGVTAEITYCWMNKILSGITNSIEIAFNIGDGFDFFLGLNQLLTSQLWQNSGGDVILIKIQDTDNFISKNLGIGDDIYVSSELWENEDGDGVLVTINGTDDFEFNSIPTSPTAIKSRFWERPDKHIIKITIDSTNQFKFVDLGI